MISIHAPARGATKEKSAPARISSFQSTLPRGERLYSGQYTCSSCAISIHAPARGATKVTVHFNQNHSNISIHAPARGATGDAKDIWLAVRNFNPRSREGSDIQPTRNKRETADKFQSTLPRGERHHSVAFSVFLLPFQSTLPRGERQTISLPF